MSPKKAFEGKDTDGDCLGASILSFLLIETSLANFRIFHNQIVCHLIGN